MIVSEEKGLAKITKMKRRRTELKNKDFLTMWLIAQTKK